MCKQSSNLDYWDFSFIRTILTPPVSHELLHTYVHACIYICNYPFDYCIVHYYVCLQCVSIIIGVKIWNQSEAVINSNFRTVTYIQESSGGPIAVVKIDPLLWCLALSPRAEWPSVLFLPTYWLWPLGQCNILLFGKDAGPLERGVPHRFSSK